MTEDQAEAVRALMVERFGVIPAPEVDGEEDPYGVPEAEQQGDRDEHRVVAA